MVKSIKLEVIINIAAIVLSILLLLALLFFEGKSVEDTIILLVAFLFFSMISLISLKNRKE